MERRIYCDFGMRTKNSDLSSMRYISANANFTVCIPINVDDTEHTSAILFCTNKSNQNFHEIDNSIVFRSIVIR